MLWVATSKVEGCWCLLGPVLPLLPWVWKAWPLVLLNWTGLSASPGLATRAASWGLASPATASILATLLV